MSWNPKDNLLKEAQMYYRDIYQESPYSSSISRGRFDAFRHSYSFAKLTRDYGEGIAELIGDFNEVLGRNEESEKRRDIYNNAVGREIGLIGGTDEELAKITSYALDRGYLKVRGTENSQASEKEISDKESEVEFFEDKVDDGIDLVYDKDGNIGHWVTINGNSVFIEEEGEGDEKSNDGY
jgi:hypothetical protein